MSVSAWNDQNNSLISFGYKYRTGTSSSIIYIVILTAAIIALSLLPFINVQISINGPGILQSEIERTEIATSVSGRITEIRMKDNQKLSRGDTLLVIDASLPGQQTELLNKHFVQLRQLLQDVNQLLQLADQAEDEGSVPALKTGQYLASWRHYLEEAEERRNAKDQAEKIFKRYSALYQSNVLSVSEYEKFKFDYDQALSNYLELTKRYKSQWQMEAMSYRDELRTLAGREAELTAQRKLYTLTASVNGSLQNLSGLQAGTYVFANQKIGEISPDTKLIAYCFIKPSDIGLIRLGQEVNFQIDAFNYNQWGMLSGKVLDISDDVIIINEGQPVFRVKCSLDSDHLTLNNEYRGYVKKGMNFTARFRVAERSLFHLLYDQADDWLNPNLEDT